LHVVFLDGAYYEQGSQLAWQALGHLQTREVGQVLQRVVRRIDKHLRRHGLLEGLDPSAELEDPDDQLAASAVSGQAPRPLDRSGAAAFRHRAEEPQRLGQGGSNYVDHAAYEPIGLNTWPEH
jgi:hypothetical protein